MDYISLIVFVAVIVAAFLFKANTGLVAILAAMALTFAAPHALGMEGESFKDIAKFAEKFLSGKFDSKMFLMLFGVMFLFCLAQENKTLDVLARKVIALSNGKVKLFPVILV